MVSTAQPSGDTPQTPLQRELFGEYGAAVRCSPFLSQCSHRYSVLSLLTQAALQPPAAVQRLPLARVLWAHPRLRRADPTSLSCEVLRAGFFASIRSCVLQQPRMQYAQKCSSFHAAAAGSVAQHCSSSSSTHSLSSTQHALCSSTPDRSDSTEAHLYCTALHCTALHCTHTSAQASTRNDFARRPALPSLPFFVHSFAALSFASRLACLICLSAFPLYHIFGS